MSVSGSLLIVRKMAAGTAGQILICRAASLRKLVIGDSCSLSLVKIDSAFVRMQGFGLIGIVGKKQFAFGQIEAFGDF